jgi:hypothetical protein
VLAVHEQRKRWMHDKALIKPRLANAEFVISLRLRFAGEPDAVEIHL